MAGHLGAGIFKAFAENHNFGLELNKDPREAVSQVDSLKFFLATAPVNWASEQVIRRRHLPNGGSISCILWNGIFHITSTDIIRCLCFRFYAFGRPVCNLKKFEEYVFSDLRALKEGRDATLEEANSPFLRFCHQHGCIKTKKRQKIYFWYSVPHDRLFVDALERDLKRECMGVAPTTRAMAEPALSFHFDASRSLYEQLLQSKAQLALEGEDWTELDPSPKPVEIPPIRVANENGYAMWSIDSRSESRSFSSSRTGKRLWDDPQMTDVSTTPEQAWICPHSACRKRFKRNDYLQRHLNTVHVISRGHKCDDCHSIFTRRDNLMQHLKKHA